MNPVDISKLTSLWVWYLGDPAAPRKVGTVSLIPAGKRCSFVYDDSWHDGGFPLSLDMPLGRKGGIILPKDGWEVPGALADAMPDRWGQSTINAIDRPKRRTALDYLYYAGDRRFGALGISTSPDAYLPCPADPLLTVDSMEEANALIQRILAREPLTDHEKRMLQSGRTMGGAQPKMLVSIDDKEWIAKFPNGSNVDQPLIEHASMVLARDIGLHPVESRVHPIGHEHVVLTRRFDRRDAKRLHALSAKTMLVQEEFESYGAMAAVIRGHGAPEPAEMKAQRRELFARMVFNILMDNTDDHTKNHAFLRRNSGHYELAPAFDIPPQMNGLGAQAIPVAFGADGFDRETVVQSAANFGMSLGEARQVWLDVAAGVSRWKEVFSNVGVLGVDIDYLADFLDSDEKLAMRQG